MPKEEAEKTALDNSKEVHSKQCVNKDQNTNSKSSHQKVTSDRWVSRLRPRKVA